MTDTDTIARTHGYTGPLICKDCGTTEELHFVSWFDPATGGSGDFLQCCICGIKAGDSDIDHIECGPDSDDEAEELDADPGPEVRVFHRPDGWTLSLALSPLQTPEACTSNHHRQQDGRPACTATAVWKVVEDHGMHLSIGFWCDDDLPGPAAPPASAPTAA